MAVRFEPRMSTWKRANTASASLPAPEPSAASQAWIRYVGDAVEQLPPVLDRFPVYQDEMARLPVAYELVVKPEEGRRFTWAGVRVVRAP